MNSWSKEINLSRIRKDKLLSSQLEANTELLNLEDPRNLKLIVMDSRQRSKPKGWIPSNKILRMNTELNRTYVNTLKLWWKGTILRHLTTWAMVFQETQLMETEIILSRNTDSLPTILHRINLSIHPIVHPITKPSHSTHPTDHRTFHKVVTPIINHNIQAEWPPLRANKEVKECNQKKFLIRFTARTVSNLQEMVDNNHPIKEKFSLMGLEAPT